MRFFSRVTLICNLCFIASVIFRLIDIAKKARVNTHTNGEVKLDPIVSSIVVLGWIAIFINIVFVCLFLARFATKKMNNIPRWIVYTNIILLPMQIYYYFFSNF